MNGKNKIQVINTWAVALLRYIAEALRANYTKTKIDKTPKKLCGI